jgi:crotonobetainyl-CoA:carnitine CoA-transferase CaiB-like acyl-CoA transferase
VKIERPGLGEEMRTAGRYKGREEHEDYFHASNRNKKSIELDLKSAAHREIAQALAAHADVVVENFAPGTANKLGMSWEDLRILNSRLVYCSISGFGQSGPYRDRLAVDSVIQGITGLMSVTGFPDGPPAIVGAPLTDIISGMFGAFAVVGALHAVRRDGVGSYIDVAMQAATLAAIGPRLAEALQCGRAQQRIGNGNPLRVPSDTYVTRDGRYLCVAVVNERHWPSFCRAIERMEWIEDPRFATKASRLANREVLGELARAAFKERDLGAWISRFAGERIPYAPVNDYVEAVADEQIAHRGMVRELGHPDSGSIKVLGSPWVATFAAPALTSPPRLGQHTEEVLHTWLGWEPEAIRAFNAELAGLGAAARAGAPS